MVNLFPCSSMAKRNTITIFVVPFPTYVVVNGVGFTAQQVLEPDDYFVCGSVAPDSACYKIKSVEDTSHPAGSAREDQLPWLEHQS